MNFVEQFNGFPINVGTHEVVVEHETPNSMSKLTPQVGKHGCRRNFSKFILVEIVNVVS